MFISFVCWIVVGAIVGAIVGKFVSSGDDDPKIAIAIAAAAAVLVGFVLRLSSHEGPSWPGIWGLAGATVAAALAVAIWHFSRRASRA